MEKQAEVFSGSASDDRGVESRASAAECLRLAARATNLSSRASLLMMAQSWMEKAVRREPAADAPPPEARPASKA
jgi:hypothetical protein